MKEEKINISLSKEEALVLFEFLSRYLDTDKLEIEDQSEAQALWDLASLFEKELVEPFDKNYQDILAKARKVLKSE